MLEFTWPYVFLALPLPLIVYKLLTRAPRQDAALYIPFFSVLSRLQSDNENLTSGHLLNLICCTLIWLLIVLAASRPQWLGDPVQLPSTGRDLMLSVDISGSMEAQDMVVGNRQASRIDVVKAVVGDFVERREGDRLGLILFAAHAYIQAPLTFDRETVGKLLEEADIGIIEESATAIGDAIGLGVIHLRKRPENARVLILLTDGVNNAGAVSPEQAGQLARIEKIKIYTIGIGADQVVQRTFFGARAINPSAELDEQVLSQIAESTGGRYFRARDVNDLVEIYEELDRLETIEQDEQTYRPTRVLFYWPLGAAMLISFILALLSIPWLSLAGKARVEAIDGEAEAAIPSGSNA
ncbi:MAG TPA: BatB protein [Gammaproteobacteria bacterium]|jgi:Ca-activated chloride channel family protein|nr:BatB protein [Gammaproteobacteria bacterium]HAT25765.1 BatB protein [Gammaproteobacteria bacterium]HIL61974.1 VWA domain-containing protein [Porticoccaceae bacterium]|tara:strand:- start:589 stop:1650 length:1062 start_codon:yes stop_codon:yes gene_type:complete